MKLRDLHVCIVILILLWILRLNVVCATLWNCKMPNRRHLPSGEMDRILDYSWQEKPNVTSDVVSTSVIRSSDESGNTTWIPDLFKNVQEEVVKGKLRLKTTAILSTCPSDAGSTLQKRLIPRSRMSLELVFVIRPSETVYLMLN